LSISYLLLRTRLYAINVCVATSFYQRSANHVSFYLLFNLRNLFYLITARQENPSIRMIHAFQYMGIPRFVLTDNMRSVVLHRDLEGYPAIWRSGRKTTRPLCKPLLSRPNFANHNIPLPQERWSDWSVLWRTIF